MPDTPPDTDIYTEIPKEQPGFEELWAQLSPSQRRFVVARMDYGSKKEAADSCGIAPGTVYAWPKVVDECFEMMVDDTLASAQGMLRRGLTRAVLTKLYGLESDDERIAQLAATEIIDRLMGKPTQRQEVKHDGSLDIESETLASTMERLLDRASKFEEPISDDAVSGEDK